jgi:hypothetical protein
MNRKYKMSTEEEVNCFVCFEILGEGTGLVTLKCGHIYCPSCFAQHMRRDNLCGICRTEVTEESPKDVEVNLRRDIEREIRDEEEAIQGPSIWPQASESVYFGLMNTFMSHETRSHPLFDTHPSNIMPVSLQEIMRDFIDSGEANNERSEG